MKSIDRIHGRMKAKAKATAATMVKTPIGQKNPITVPGPIATRLSRVQLIWLVMFGPMVVSGRMRARRKDVESTSRGQTCSRSTLGSMTPTRSGNEKPSHRTCPRQASLGPQKRPRTRESKRTPLVREPTCRLKGSKEESGTNMMIQIVAMAMAMMRPGHHLYNAR
jgi:hypothetical protein